MGIEYGQVRHGTPINPRCLLTYTGHGQLKVSETQFSVFYGGNLISDRFQKPVRFQAQKSANFFKYIYCQFRWQILYYKSLLVSLSLGSYSSIKHPLKFKFFLVQNNKSFSKIVLGSSGTPFAPPNRPALLKIR